MSICVEVASIEFSISSFNALEGRWIISPAAILSTTWHVNDRETDGEHLFVQALDGFYGVCIVVRTFCSSR